jgi:chemosensory pili system protein ChpA (sensor histidine kinase/response regulator)
MFRRAHERVLLTQVAREIQVNLRRMEQVLDAFFRDHTKRASWRRSRRTASKFAAH